MCSAPPLLVRPRRPGLFIAAPRDALPPAFLEDRFFMKPDAGARSAQLCSRAVFAAGLSPVTSLQPLTDFSTSSAASGASSVANLIAAQRCVERCFIIPLPSRRTCHRPATTFNVCDGCFCRLRSLLDPLSFSLLVASLLYFLTDPLRQSTRLRSQ